MSTELRNGEIVATENETQNETQNKKRRGAGPWLVLCVFLLLFAVTTAILGSHLYKMATYDQYTVDLAVGELDSSIELFRIEYSNLEGEVTVQGTNGQNVVAPGTTVTYDIRLRNNEEMVIDFLMTPTVEFLTKDPVPVQFRIVDDYGNYILGSATSWATADEMNALAHKGSVRPGEVFTYHVSWQWIFEVDGEQNAYDTYLGVQDGANLPGLSIGIETESVANPMPLKSNRHMMHLLGEGFGCCWCCWLVWVLVFICLLLSIWVVRLKRKLNKLQEELDELTEEAPDSVETEL